MRILMFVCLLMFSVNVASIFAHDGGFGHSRRLIYVSRQADSLEIEYRLKQGLEEALVELVHIDTDHNGKISQREKDRYFVDRGKALVANLELRDARTGKPLQASLAGHRLEHSLVQVYRILIPGDVESVELVDRNFPHKPGQVAIEVDTGLKAELPEEIDLSHVDQVRVRIERVAKEKP